MKLLLSTSANLYCSHTKKIRKDFDELKYLAKVTLPNGNHRTLSEETKSKQTERKW